MSEEEKKPRGRKPTKDPYFGQAEESAVKEFLSLGQLVEDPRSLEGFRWTGTTKEEFRRNEIYRHHLQAPLNKMIESIIRRYMYLTIFASVGTAGLKCKFASIGEAPKIRLILLLVSIGDTSVAVAY